MTPLIGPKAKGKKLPRLDWLVIPLCDVHHREEYGGLDAGVVAWERQFGTQVEHLTAIAKILDVDIWKLAGVALS